MKIPSFSRSHVRNLVIAFTLLLSVANATFYIADTMTGKPVFANSLKVLGFCPGIPTAPDQLNSGGTDGSAGSDGSNGVNGQAGTEGKSGPRGPKGDTGAIGPKGPIGDTLICQPPINLTAIPQDIIPAGDNVYSLGSEQFKWKSIHIGPGTIYIQDVTTGLQAGLTVDEGSLLIDGTDSLRLGNVRITKSGIESVLSSQDLTIGNLGDLGYATFARGIKFPDGTIQTTSMLRGLTGDTGAQGPQGPQGATGAQGPAGPLGFHGSFYSTANQYVTANRDGSNYPVVPINPLRTAVTLNVTDAAATNGVSIVAGSRITVANAGTYNIEFSAQLRNFYAGGAQNSNVAIWISKNGVDVPFTSTWVYYDKYDKKNAESWNFFVSAAAGDYFELMWWDKDGNTMMLAEPAQTTPVVIPAVPSVILTVDQVG